MPDNGEIIIGIDLGTTNSEAAVSVNGKIEVIDVDGSPILPSCVAISEAGALVVGHEARNQYIVYPERTVKSIKRRMGTNDKVGLGDKEFTPQEISAMILRKLKDAAEKRLGCEVRKAVITVPAQFSDAQRQATRDAGVIAGLEVMRILNEPTAACLAYEAAKGTGAKKILAFDLGGGTFDVSIVKTEGEVVEVVSSHGDNHLGGDDMDDMIATWIEGKIYTRPSPPSPLSKVGKHRLIRAAETAKTHLSDQTHARIIENNLPTTSPEAPAAADEELSRHEFEEMIRPLIDKMLVAVHKALADAKLRAAEIDEIILVGGATRIPAIQEVLERELGKRPRRDVHPDLAVAIGAGVMAARLMGEKNQRMLVDITPYTFGTSSIEISEFGFDPHKFVPIIKAGTPLPVTHSEPFCTLSDNQREVRIDIFQGEDPDARKNILIGDFKGRRPVGGSGR